MPTLRKQPRAVQLLDTTLRDGEQTPDVAFSSDEKLAITRLLLEHVGVDRVEVCSALVSLGEQQTAARVARWAAASGQLQRVEALGYADGARSVEWLRAAGLGRMNLLVKGSERHCRFQLGLSASEHLDRIAATLAAAQHAQLEISGVYLEDWSRGTRESPAYVGGMLQALERLGVGRVYLADTLGVLDPSEVLREVRRVRRAFPGLALEFHAHDDYGLATANCLAAVRAGVNGLHVTVNGLGERAGNACLAQVVVALRDHAGLSPRVNEARLFELSQVVAAASGLPVAHNAPVLGASVFTQTAGIHADGDAKAGLYCSELTPERFARQREVALGKLSGRASLRHHLRELGVELAPREGGGQGAQTQGGQAHGLEEQGLEKHGFQSQRGDVPDEQLLERLLQKVVEQGDRKQRVRPSDLQRWLAPTVIR